MTKLIYVHLDFNKYSFSKSFYENKYVFNSLPEYANVSINKSKNYFHDVILLDSTYDKEQIENLYKLLSNKYPHFIKDPFWFFTLARLLYVLKYCIKNKVEKFIHMEYDNLLYSNDSCFNNLPEGIYFTKVGPSIGSAGFCYSNSSQQTEKFYYSLLELLNNGEGFLAQQIKSTHLYEMEMIDYLNTKGICEYLPLLPEDKYYTQTGYLFDGASYGQFLAGTNNGDNKGWFGLHHFVGQELNKKNIDIGFEVEPFVIKDGKNYKLYNLHLHNKKLIGEFV